MSDAGLIVPVLLGSVRPERQAVRVGRMLMNALIAGGHEPVGRPPGAAASATRAHLQRPKGKAMRRPGAQEVGCGRGASYPAAGRPHRIA